MCLGFEALSGGRERPYFCRYIFSVRLRTKCSHLLFFPFSWEARSGIRKRTCVPFLSSPFCFAAVSFPPSDLATQIPHGGSGEGIGEKEKKKKRPKPDTGGRRYSRRGNKETERRIYQIRKKLVRPGEERAHELGVSLIFHGQSLGEVEDSFGGKGPCTWDPPSAPPLPHVSWCVQPEGKKGKEDGGGRKRRVSVAPS